MEKVVKFSYNFADVTKTMWKKGVTDIFFHGNASYTIPIIKKMLELFFQTFFSMGLN